MERDLALVIPVFNDQRRLVRTLSRLRRFAGRTAIRLSVVISDDASTDRTHDVVREFESCNTIEFYVELLENPRRGKGAAVRNGIRSLRAPIVGYLDADFSPGEQALLDLYQRLLKGGDMAIAVRGWPDSNVAVHQPWYREASGRIFNAFFCRMTGVPFKGTQCGLKLFRPAVAKELFRHQRLDGFAFDTELLVIAYKMGFEVQEIAITLVHCERSKLSIRRETLRMGIDLIRIVLWARSGQIRALGASSPGAPSPVGPNESSPDTSRVSPVRRSPDPRLPERHERHNAYQRTYFEGGGKATLSPTGSSYLRRHVDQMIQFAGIRPGDRVLEVGCGLGRYTFILAELGIRIEGVDLSPSLVKQLGALNGGRYDLTVYAHDLLSCPEEMFGRYDAVIGFFVLHHVHDLNRCLSMAAKLVVPGGRVAFLEPNPVNILYYIQIAVTPGMTWKGEKGMLAMKERILAPTIQEAGLTRLPTHRFGFFPPFLTNLPLCARLETVLQRISLLEPVLPFQLFGGTKGGSFPPANLTAERRGSRPQSSTGYRA